MSYAIIWGTQSQLDSSSVANEVYAYCDRLTHTVQMQVREVMNGLGDVKYRRIYQPKIRVEGTFTVIDEAAAEGVRGLFLEDTPILVTDETFGDINVYLDSETRERIAGESGPMAGKQHITGWAYPNLGEGSSGTQGEAGWGALTGYMGSQSMA